MRALSASVTPIPPLTVIAVASTPRMVLVLRSSRLMYVPKVPPSPETVRMTRSWMLPQQLAESVAPVRNVRSRTVKVSIAMFGWNVAAPMTTESVAVGTNDGDQLLAIAQSFRWDPDPEPPTQLRSAGGGGPTSPGVPEKVAVPADVEYVATTITAPVSSTVARPVVSIVTRAVFVVAQRAGPGMMAAAASRMVAAKRIVSPTRAVATSGVMVMTNDPSDAVIGTVPASGVSVMLAVGFTPARMVSTLVPRCVSVEPSKARTVNRRDAPAGMEMDPVATPATTGKLKTIVGMMSGAETSTTSVVAVSSPMGTTMTRRPTGRPSGPISRGAVTPRSQASPVPSANAAAQPARRRRRREADLSTASSSSWREDHGVTVTTAVTPRALSNSGVNVMLPPPPPGGPPHQTVSAEGVHVPVAPPTGIASVQENVPAFRVPTAGLRALHVLATPTGGVSVTSNESTPGVLASRMFTLAVIDAPTAALAVAGTTVNRSSDVPAVTVIVLVAALPSDVAVIVTVPASRPVTTPPVVAHAVGGLPVAKPTTAPPTTAPSASFTVGTMVTLDPARTVALGGASVIATLPTTAVTGTDPIPGTSVNETVGFVPETTVIVVDPEKRTMPALSNACAVMTRPLPTGTVSVPLALPATIGRL